MQFQLAITLVLALRAAAPAYGESPRIVQGLDAADNAYPYQVSLRESGVHICGAVILTRNYVVTAAHCVAQPNRGLRRIFRPWIATNTSLLSLYIGSSMRTTGGEVVQVGRNIPHPRYRPRRYRNDIALLQVSETLTFGESVMAIAIAGDRPPAGAEVIVLGWGNTSTDGSPSDTLKYLAMNVVTRRRCRRSFRARRNTVICLQSNSTSGPCDGDSGGAAVYQGTLVGLTSFRRGSDCTSEDPDGFTYVPNYVEWIMDNSDL